MIAQADLFAQQLDMFAGQPKPEAAPAAKPIYYGMPPAVARMWERAATLEVEQDILAVFAAHPGEFLDWPHFRAVIKKHDIGSCFGHVLHRLSSAGKLEAKNVYLGKGVGAEQPGSPNYHGYRTEYRIKGENDNG